MHRGHTKLTGAKEKNIHFRELSFSTSRQAEKGLREIVLHGLNGRAYGKYIACLAIQEAQGAESRCSACQAGAFNFACCGVCVCAFVWFA